MKVFIKWILIFWNLCIFKFEMVQTDQSRFMSLDTEDIVIEMNFHRQFTEPPATRITCLEWDKNLENDILAMPHCQPSVDKTTLFNVSQIPQTYFEVFSTWQRGYRYYHFNDNSCENGKSCTQFKTMMNEKVNYFACAQFMCPKFVGFPDPSISYYVTICKFDEEYPSSIPYKPSGYFRQGCNETSCNWPEKTQCYNHFICCNPVLTTVMAPSAGTSPSVLNVHQIGQFDTKNNIIQEMNFHRQFTEPPATRITCLEWDVNLENQINAMPPCTPPTDDSTIYSVSEHPLNYFEIFNSWQREFSYYHFSDNSCEAGRSCHEFKTMMNEELNYFACAQYTCPTFTGKKNPPVAYYITICKFDLPTPSKQPYKPSGYFRQGCNSTSCNWPEKTQCFNQFICCNPAPITLAPKTITEDHTSTKPKIKPFFDSNEHDIVTDMNFHRQFTEPPATRITCLEWDINLENDIKAMPVCQPPTDSSAIYSVSAHPQTYFEIFNLWQRGFLYYHFTDNSCEAGRSCTEFKTMMNEGVNYFACAQFTCPTFPGRPTTTGTNYLTICKFDQPTPTSFPYTPSGYFRQGCNATSCNWPEKNQCFNQFICCNPITATIEPNTKINDMISNKSPSYSFDSTEKDIVAEMNFHRQFTEPPAKRITCLEWDINLERDIKAMQSCTPPTDSSTIYSINQNPQTYFEVFNFWQRGFLNYHFNDDTCEAERSCNEFKTMMNEQANFFACAQFICPTFRGQPNPPNAYYVTVCKFDLPMPTRIPYTLSGYFREGCNVTSCNWPSKTQCYNQFICCNPAPITSLATTKASDKVSIESVTTESTEPTPKTTKIVLFEPPVVNSDSAEEIVSDMNFHRQFTEPPARRITCLEWDKALENDIKTMLSCKPPTDCATIYNVNQNPQTYFEVFNLWQQESFYYHFDDNTCEQGRSCKEFKTMMNEQANSFACVQFDCPTFDGLPDPPLPYYVTFCKFDQPTPSRLPYPPSGYLTHGCNATSCSTWSSKTQCYNQFICCNPGTEDMPKTTVLPPNVVSSSVAPVKSTELSTLPTEIITATKESPKTPLLNVASSTMASSNKESSLRVTCLAWETWYMSVLQTIALSCDGQSPANSTLEHFSMPDESMITDYTFANNKTDTYRSWNGHPCKTLCNQLKSVTLMNEESTLFSCAQPSCQKIVHWKLIWKAPIMKSTFQSKNNTMEIELESGR